jgi:hypothetical protein
MSSPAERAVVQAVLRFIHYDTDGNWWCDIPKAEAAVRVSLQDQQASREQERERQPSAWSEFGDGHDYSRTGRHDPLNCRLCLRSDRIAKLEAAEQQIKTLREQIERSKNVK